MSATAREVCFEAHVSAAVARHQRKRQQGVAAAVAQKPRAVSAPHCSTMYPASFGVTRRGSAPKGRRIAEVCAVKRKKEKER